MVSNTTVQDTNQSQSCTTVTGCSTLDSVEVDHTATGRGDQTRYYGCLGYRPAWLQFLAGARWFLVFACLSTFFQSAAVNGLIGATISTIERRFALASSQTAWIAASYEIAGAPSILIIGYFGLTLRRPVWIGAGLIVLGVGFGIYSIPHFAAAPYHYSDSGDFSNLCNDWNSSTSDSLPSVNDR